MKHRNTLLISLSYFISVLSTVTFIYGMLFYNRDLSAASTAAWAILYSSYTLPGGLTNFFVGVLSDMYSKRKIMMFSEVAAGLLMILFTVTFIYGYNSFIYLCIYAASLSIAFSFFEVALDASVVNIAGENSNSLVSIIWLLRSLSWLIAPILGEYLSKDIVTLFYINTASFFISAFFQVIMNQEDKYSLASLKLTNIIKRGKEDFVYLINYMKINKIVALLLGTNLVIAIFYMPVFNAIIPDMAKEVGFANSSLALTESASWLGMSIGAIIIALTNISTFLLKNVFNTIKIQGLMFMVWLLPFAMQLENKFAFIVIVGLIILDGMISTFQALGALTYFQVQIDENIRGKILGTMRTVMKITAPIGVGLYGLALEYLPWYSLLILTSIVMYGVAAFVSRNEIFKRFQKEI